MQLQQPRHGYALLHTSTCDMLTLCFTEDKVEPSRRLITAIQCAHCALQDTALSWSIDDQLGGPDCNIVHQPTANLNASILGLYIRVFPLRDLATSNIFGLLPEYASIHILSPRNQSCLPCFGLFQSSQAQSIKHKKSFTEALKIFKELNIERLAHHLPR